MHLPCQTRQRSAESLDQWAIEAADFPMDPNVKSTPSIFPGKFDAVIQSWDCAFKDPTTHSLPDRNTRGLKNGVSMFFKSEPSASHSGSGVVHFQCELSRIISIAPELREVQRVLNSLKLKRGGLVASLKHVTLDTFADSLWLGYHDRFPAH
jgi:hypothetical protein